LIYKKKNILIILLIILSINIYFNLNSNFLVIINLFLLLLLSSFLYKLFEQDKVLNEIQFILHNNLQVGNIKEIELNKLKDDNIINTIKIINKSIEYLNSKLDNTKKFNSNIAHEIKAPLTLLKTELEFSLIYKNDNFDRQVLNILQKLKTLEDIIEQLLLISNDNVGSLIKNMNRVFLHDIIIDIINEKKISLNSKDIKIIEDINITESIHANKLLIKYALSNIIDNSIKYTQNNGEIYIRLKKRASGNTTIIIKDTGIGIKQKELPLIFHPYYRGSQENGIIQGYGLGLSLATWIFNLHNASIKIRSKENIGTCVVIRF